MTALAPTTKLSGRPWSGVSYSSTQTAKSAYATASSVFHTGVNASPPSRLICIKAGSRRADLDRSGGDIKEKKLHQRLHKIDSIFTGEIVGVVRQPLEIDTAFGTIPGLQRPGSDGHVGQMTGAELPNWVLSPSGKPRQSRIRLAPIAGSDAGEVELDANPQSYGSTSSFGSLAHSTSQSALQKRKKHQKANRKAREQSSHASQDKLAPSIGCLLSHLRRDSSNAENADEATDEWCRLVRSQGFQQERKPSIRLSSESVSVKEEPMNSIPLHPEHRWTQHFHAASRKTTPVNKIRRALLRHNTAQVNDSLSGFSEKQVFELLRRASRSRMELLNEIPVVVDVFKLGGFPYLINVEWLEEIINAHSTETYLDADDFALVWQRYFDKLTDFHAEVFNKFAKEGTSVVTDSVLPAMFKELGFWPMPGALAESCSRMVPGQRLPNGITLQDFHRIYNDLYSRAGLTLNEYTKANEIFNQHATKDQMFRPYGDNSDRLDAKKLLMVLKQVQPHFLLTRQQPVILTPGFIYGLAKELVGQVAERRLTLDANEWRPVLEVLMHHIPVDDAQAALRGTIDKSEFLVACNMLHQRVANRLTVVVERIGLTVSSKFKESDVRDLFDELGHVAPSFELLYQEMKEECDLSGEEELSFAEVYILLLAYCDWDGLSHAQRDELNWLFELFMTKLPDVERKDGKLCISETRRALRWMCYTPSQHRMVTFMDVCDKNNMDYMDLKEFIEIVSDYRYVSLGCARPAFRTTLGIWTTVPVSDLERLLKLVGHHCTEDEVDAISKEARHTDDEITWHEFLRLEEFHRNEIKEKLKVNLGHTDIELAFLRKEFEANSVPNKDHIVYEGLAKIMLKYMPRMPQDEEVRRLVKESDVNGNHVIEFSEFLWIMRRLLDRDSKQQLDRIQQMMNELGYTHDEVRDMRELFNYTDTNLSGSLDINELNTLFAGLVEMNHDAEIELHVYLDQFDTEHNGELDFWEFLRLMKTLERQNWRNILGAAANQVRQEAKQKQAANHALEPSGRRSIFVPGGVGHHMML